MNFSDFNYTFNKQSPIWANWICPIFSAQKYMKLKL